MCHRNTSSPGLSRRPVKMCRLSRAKVPKHPGLIAFTRLHRINRQLVAAPASSTTQGSECAHCASSRQPPHTTVMMSVIDTHRDEYDLDSGDEADLIALVDASQSTKRKASFNDSSPASKRYQTTYPCATAALTQYFNFKSFKLKQEQVRSLPSYSRLFALVVSMPIANY